MASKKTMLFTLAKAFEDLEIKTETIQMMKYDDVISKFTDSATPQTAQALLNRLQNHLTLLSTKSGCQEKDINHLLKRLVSPKLHGKKLTRYPVRVLLSAYMILCYPDEVFNKKGELERFLSESVPNIIRDFELLVKMILDGSSFRTQLRVFDESWCSYFERFVWWKQNDSRSYEEYFVSTACEMELSMMKRCKLSATGERMDTLTHDMEAVQDQVKHDHKILRDCVRKITGEAGVERMESALSETRSKYFKEKEKETSPIVLPGRNYTDNEHFANQIIHEQSHGFSKRLDVGYEDMKDEFNVKIKVKETVEKAFWDGIEESLKQDEPDYGRVFALVKEVRDELCSIASSWKEKICDSIDIDILAQVLSSGTHDLSYLENILAYALITLRELSSPASEIEMMKTHKKLMDDLSEKANPSLVIVKGLRFVHEEIRNLKLENSKARVRMLEPVIQGPAGYDYLRKAFSDRYSSPANAHSSLPVTTKWLQSVQSVVDQEWAEYTDSVSQKSLPQCSSLRTGRSSLVTVTTDTENTHQPECDSGDKVDKMVRLGLLKLASEIQGSTPETIPETLELNLLKLRNSQEQLQRIIVTSTSNLVLRQNLASEKLTEPMVSTFFDRLTERLSRPGDVGIHDIVETMEESSGSEDEKCAEARKESRANMLAKHLRQNDPVFGVVSRSVYAAARAIVFGGSGLQGRKLAEKELLKIGASLLTDKLVKVVEELIWLARVSSNVHRSWYEEISNSPRKLVV